MTPANFTAFADALFGAMAAQGDVPGPRGGPNVGAGRRAIRPDTATGVRDVGPTRGLRPPRPMTTPTTRNAARKSFLNPFSLPLAHATAPGAEGGPTRTNRRGQRPWRGPRTTETQCETRTHRVPTAYPRDPNAHTRNAAATSLYRRPPGAGRCCGCIGPVAQSG